MHVRILGAGSAGTHLAFGCRQRNWQVSVVDKNPDALTRMREELFPRRYGQWDSAIRQELLSDAGSPCDAVFIATPPDTHLALALAELKRNPKFLLIEKPLCAPNDPLLPQLLAQAGGKTKIFVGYNHNLTPNTAKALELVRAGRIGEVLRLDVEARENIQYIMDAHWWIAGLKDSYLGHSARGGGSLCEHSHAVALWLHFARQLGFGNIASVSAQLKMQDSYDSMASLLVETERGLPGSIHTDFVTRPAVKRAQITGSQGRITWWANRRPGFDCVELERDGEAETFDFPKKRPDDFLPQIRWIEEGGGEENSLERGVHVMRVAEAAFRSHESGKRESLQG